MALLQPTTISIKKCFFRQIPLHKNQTTRANTTISEITATTPALE
jgi:hypothetical protein